MAVKILSFKGNISNALIKIYVSPSIVFDCVTCASTL